MPFVLFDSKAVVVTEEDAKLVDALRRDDRAAINSIFLKYHAILCRIAYRMVNDSDEAKDVVQEVFIKLWRNRNGLGIEHSIEAYLKRAVVNTSLNRLERQKRFTPLEDLTRASTHEMSEENRQITSELQERIAAAINALPSRTKAVFSLIRFEDMTYKEVADSLDISVKAVEKEMMKALRMLRTALRDYLVFLMLVALNSGFINI